MTANTSHRRHEAGFTLLESLLAGVILASVATTAFIGATYISNQSERDQVVRAQYQDSQVALGEIERAIRDSTEIVQAGEGKLVLKTRYYIDSDDEVEQVSFALEGTDLVFSWPDGNRTLSRVLLADVTDFTAQSMRFFEHFDRADYGATAAAPVSDVVNPREQAEYKLASLSTIKAGLDPYVQTDRSRLEVPASATTQTLTVSPEIPKDGLRIETSFSPLDSGVEYQPIVWGDAALNTNQVAVVFQADQSIRLSTVEGGAMISDNSTGLTWSPSDTYEFRVKFKNDSAVATVSVNGGRFEMIGKVDTGALDNKAIRFRTVSSNARAAWDSINIDYPFIEVYLQVDAGSRTQELWGGATKRDRTE